MTPDSNTITNIHNWFGKAVPVVQDRNQYVQLGVHFEEIGEMAQALLSVPGSDEDTERALVEFLNQAKTLADRFKTGKARFQFNSMDDCERIELLDSLMDQIVTSVGIAYMLGMDAPNALDEVNRGNWSKFDEEGNPIFDENGKVKKGPNYLAPSLDGYV